MNNIRTDQDCRDGTVKMICDLYRFSGIRAALVGKGFQTGAGYGRKSCFHHRKEHRARDQNRDRNQPGYTTGTAIVHKDLSLSSFIWLVFYHIPREIQSTGGTKRKGSRGCLPVILLVSG
jgi:hypothetical protein